jgi:hypothetical protein
LDTLTNLSLISNPTILPVSFFLAVKSIPALPQAGSKIVAFLGIKFFLYKNPVINSTISLGVKN